MKTLDCRNQQCPAPVVATRKELLAAPGDPLTVLVGDQTARENVGRLAASLGYAVAVRDEADGFLLELTQVGTPAPPVAGTPASGPTVVFVTAETLGSGDDQLGRLLLKNFLITLLDLEQAPDALFFVNAGVRLACQGSEVLEALDQLACRGTDVAACGLCLEFFGLKEQLAAGRATNMFDIVSTLSAAGRVIRP